MHRLGVSVYPDIKPLNEIKEYLKLAAENGCTRVFSSMFSVEGSKEEVLDYFKELIDSAHEVGIQVSLDVNPECLERVGASPDDLSVFNDLHVDIIRMDLSFGDDGDLQLINNPYGILIEFNASIIDSAHIKRLIDKGVEPSKILVCHNFYPQRYTGMKWNKFRKINKELKELGVRVGAFISSNEKDTHGVWDATDGLCTVEKLRGLSIDLQLRLLLATDHVDDVLIGNAYASEKEFQLLAQTLKPVAIDQDNPIIKMILSSGFIGNKNSSQKKVRVHLDSQISDIEKEILFDFYPHCDMGDSSEWIWRSRLPRFIYNTKTIEPRNSNKDYFERGSIVVVNDNYKHYSGEIQIVLEPIENDGQRNFLGYIDEKESMMLELINDGDIVVFIK